MRTMIVGHGGRESAFAFVRYADGKVRRVSMADVISWNNWWLDFRYFGPPFTARTLPG